MFDSTIRALRYAVAVADYGGFNAAAQNLYVSQPHLSRQIRQLEDYLGTAIFNREAAGAAPTQAGKKFLDSIRGILTDLDNTFNDIKSDSSVVQKLIRIGFCATGVGELMTQIRIAFSKAYPNVATQPKKYDWCGEVEALRNGSVDVAFIWLPCNLEGIKYTIIAQEPRVVGMPAGHPLAHKEFLTLDDVKNEPLMWTNRAPHIWVNWWAVNPRPDGRSPIWGPVNGNVEEMLECVATGLGICFAPKSMPISYGRNDLAWRPLHGVEDLRIAIGYLVTNTNPLVKDFVDIAIAASIDSFPSGSSYVI